MTALDIHDALVSVRVAADLCGLPVDRVLSMIANKIIRPEKVEGRPFVSLLAVEKAVRKGEQHDSSI